MKKPLLIFAVLLMLGAMFLIGESDETTTTENSIISTE